MLGSWLLGLVGSKLAYGDSRSTWFEEAVRIQLQIDPILDEVLEAEDTKRRGEFVEAAVKKKVDRVKQNPNYDAPAERMNHKKNH